MRQASLELFGEELTIEDGKPIDINTDMTFTINSENGNYNIIEIKNKKVILMLLKYL